MGIVLMAARMISTHCSTLMVEGSILELPVTNDTVWSVPLVATMLGFLSLLKNLGPASRQNYAVYCPSCKDQLNSCHRYNSGISWFELAPTWVTSNFAAEYTQEYMELPLEALSQRYNLQLSFLDKIAGGFLSENYAVTEGSKKYFLKKHRHASLSQVEGVCQAEQFFAEGGIPVILPLPASDGKA